MLISRQCMSGRKTGRLYFLNNSTTSNANEFPGRSDRHCPDVAFSIFRYSSNSSDTAAICPRDFDETSALVSPEPIAHA
jgi:hypothetical protein